MQASKMWASHFKILYQYTISFCIILFKYKSIINTYQISYTKNNMEYFEVLKNNSFSVLNLYLLLVFTGGKVESYRVQKLRPAIPG